MPFSRLVGVGSVLLTVSLGVGGCTKSEPEPKPGPLAVASGYRLVDEQQADGRIWRVYNDCAMARNMTWVSDDGGRRWLHYDGPGFINCQVASAVRLKAVSRHDATAEVDHGPRPVHEGWHTTDGGRKWTMTSTDLGG